MKKATVLILVISIVILGFVIKDLLFSDLIDIEKGVNDLLTESDKKIFLPSPLVSDKDTKDSYLSKKGIIEFTNAQRQKYGLPPLKGNSQLDSSAEVKVEDMFVNQYFEHESPAGLNVSDLADSAGYKFILLGENLAMGNFEDDEALIQAWMNSEGHRENILNPSFTEIGVFVLRGTFKGKSVWMAVQHFALPLSACPKANESIKSKIEENEKQIVEIEQTLNSMKDNLKTRRDVKEYNDLVLKHNALVDVEKALIEEYNQQVRIFNQCLTEAVQLSH